MKYLHRSAQIYSRASQLYQHGVGSTGRNAAAFVLSAFFASGLAFLLLEVSLEKSARQSRIHNKPEARFLVCFDILGGALRRELKLSGPDLRTAATSAVTALASAAKALKLKTRFWDLSDRKVWDKTLEYQQQLLQKYREDARRLYGSNRSTLLPRKFRNPKPTRALNLARSPR